MNKLYNVIFVQENAKFKLVKKATVEQEKIMKVKKLYVAHMEKPPVFA